MKKLIIILFVLFLTGCTTQGIKQPPVSQPQTICPLHDLLIQATNSVYRVYTITTLKPVGTQEKGEQLTVLGNAFAINRHQLLTVKHVTSRDMYPIFTRFGTMTMYIPPDDKEKEEVWLLLDDGGSRALTKVIYRGKELDFAVLEIEDEMSFPVYSIGNFDDFQILDKIFVISNFGTGENVKTGHIVQLDYGERIEPGVYERNNNKFTIQIPNEEGDSGAPVFLFRNNCLEVVGIIESTTTGSQGLGYAVRINSAMDEFRAWQNEREL